MRGAVHLALTCGFAALVAAACGPASSFDYDGEWIGNRDLKLPDTPKDVAYTIGRVTLRIKGNKFDLTDRGMPGHGTLAYRPDRADLQLETIAGQPLERAGDSARLARTMTLWPQPGGSVLFDDPIAIDGKPLALKRVQSKP